MKHFNGASNLDFEFDNEIHKNIELPDWLSENHDPVYPRALRVLCVDDNRDSADSEALLLQIHGCEVSVCYNGRSALEEALHFAPDVCLIDYTMPQMSGAEVGRRLRSWRRGRPIYLVAVTAHGSSPVREITIKAGFDVHLVKPIDWDELLRNLSEKCRHYGRATLL